MSAMPGMDMSMPGMTMPDGHDGHGGKATFHQSCPYAPAASIVGLAPGFAVFAVLFLVSALPPQALEGVIQSNDHLFARLDVERFFFSVRPYYKPYRVGRQEWRGANAGDTIFRRAVCRGGSVSMRDVRTVS